MEFGKEDVKQIEDQDLLIEIIRNQDLDYDIKLQAAYNIEDKSVFADFAHDSDPDLRMYAAIFLTDDEILKDMILNDPDNHVARIATRNFISNCDIEKESNQDFLLEFAFENPRYVKFLKPTLWAERACERIPDDSKLLKVIEKSDNPSIYQKAISEVKDRQLLFDLLHNGNLPAIKSLYLAKELEDDETLFRHLRVPVGPYVPKGKVFPNIFPADKVYASIVFDYPNEEIVIMALNNIGFKSTMQRIIDYHQDPRIRELARERLEYL